MLFCRCGGLFLGGGAIALEIEELSVLVKVHFAKLVAALAEELYNLVATACALEKLGIPDGSVEYVGVIALSVIGYDDGQVHAAPSAHVGKECKAAVEALELGKISLGRLLGEYDDALAALQHLDALANRLYHINVAVGGDEVKARIKKGGDGACYQAEMPYG